MVCFGAYLFSFYATDCHYHARVMSCVDVVEQDSSQVGIVRTPQGDHESWQPEISTEIELLYHRLQQGHKRHQKERSHQNNQQICLASSLLGRSPINGPRLHPTLDYIYNNTAVCLKEPNRVKILYTEFMTTVGYSKLISA